MTERPALRFIALSTFVYGLFLWTSYEFIYVPRVTPDALVMLAGYEMDILDELEKMGEVVEVESAVPGGTPAYMEPFTRPENLPMEFMQIFDQVGKKATDANSFWDDVVEKGTTYSEPDKLTFEQASRLGLAPGSEEPKK